MKYHRNVLELIGKTPLVEIRKLNPNPRVKLLAKLESFNPGGSVKDRIALSMIEEAEKRGELTPGKIILEATSGNTGIGLAMVAAVKGYRVLLVMPESVSLERRRILQAYGAEILLTPAHLGTDGAIEEAYRLAREEPDRFFLTDQYNNPDNPLAHYRGTAEEIWEQTGGKVDVVVIAMGTTGTLMGVARRLKEYTPRVRVIGVEPTLGHRIQGLKNLKESYVPGIFDRELIDEKMTVEDEDAYRTSRRLAREEGILAGMSSGAAVWAACKVAEGMSEGVIVTILPDSGERYLSTPLFEERPALSLHLYNTLTRSTEPLRLQDPKRALMYTCGPTVHGPLHLGEWRRLVVADLLRRLLEAKGIEVTHVVNITDIDDKTISRAEREGVTLKELTEKYAEEFFQEARELDLLPADHYPKASEHIEEMIRLTEQLMKRGYAYERLRSVYFAISHFRDYGKLSKVDLKGIKVGHTVDLDSYEKDNPRDFTLFKRCSLRELKAGIYYETPWGKVRPGWHIECVAMAMKHLGETLDLHTASTDLIFPHNENEIAIAEALTGRPFSLHWVHAELVYHEGKKMSHEGGNAVTLGELLEKGFTGKEIRYFLLSTHYRKPLHFSYKALYGSVRAWDRLNDFLVMLTFCKEGPDYPPLKDAVQQMEEDFSRALDDDLNVSAALAAIFRFIRWASPRIQKEGLSPADREMILRAMRHLDQVLAVMEFPSQDLRSRVRELLQRRAEARRRKDFDLSDRLREELASLGVEVLDTPEGEVLRRRKVTRLPS